MLLCVRVCGVCVCALRARAVLGTVGVRDWRLHVCGVCVWRCVCARRHLYLNNNQLTGAIPPSLSSLVNLT